MAVHETAHMFQRGKLPAREDDLRELAAKFSAPGDDGFLGMVRLGARRVVDDDHKWEALANEVSADFVAHFTLRHSGAPDELASEVMAYQGAVVWLAGCRAIGSTAKNLDNWVQAFEGCGASILRLEIALAHLSPHFGHQDLMPLYRRALDMCIQSWSQISRLWAQGFSSKVENPRDHEPTRTGHALGEWGQEQISTIWNSWWSPGNRSSMSRADEVLAEGSFDFLNL